MVKKGSLGEIGIMRKGYETPTITFVGLEVEPMMNVASAEIGGAGVGDRPVGGDTPDLSATHRGDWGNLWK